MSIFQIDRVASEVSITQGELSNAERVVRTSPDGTRLYVEGGFGSLWRAGTNGEYAIKCFFGNDSESAYKEFELLRKLNDCSYTPTVYCVGLFTDDNGVTFPAIVESFIKGSSLQQVISSGLLSGSIREGIDARSASIIVLEIAKALDCLAKHDVSHRDLSSANIMLTDDCLNSELSNGAKVYLIDFGQSTRNTRVTVTARHDSRLAYVPFGAPEVFGGEFRRMRNSSKCDTWSLGAIVVAMMAGEYWPISINDLRSVHMLSAEALDRIAEAKRFPMDLVSLAHLETPTREERALADIVRSCTEYNPHLRPTLEGIIATLEAYVQSSPERITPIVKRTESIPDTHSNEIASAADRPPRNLFVNTTEANGNGHSSETLIFPANTSDNDSSDSELSTSFFNVNERTEHDEGFSSDMNDDRTKLGLNLGSETDYRDARTNEEPIGDDSRSMSTSVGSEHSAQDNSSNTDVQGNIAKGIEYLLETHQIDFPNQGGLVYLRNTDSSRSASVCVHGVFDNGTKRSKQGCMRLAPGGRGFVAFKHAISDVSISDVTFTNKQSPTNRLHWTIQYVNSARGLVRLELFNRTDMPIKIRKIVAMASDSNGVTARAVDNRKVCTLAPHESTTIVLDNRRMFSALIGENTDVDEEKSFALYVDGVEIHEEAFFSNHNASHNLLGDTDDIDSLHADIDRFLEAVDNSLQEEASDHSESTPDSYAWTPSTPSMGESNRNTLGSDKATLTQDEPRKVSRSRNHAKEATSKLERGVRWLKRAKELELSGDSSDSAKADRIRTYYEYSANAGNAEAQYTLGLRYFNGEGVRQDKKKAFDYFQRASQQWHRPAMFQVARCYIMGEGVKVNQEKGFTLCKKAATYRVPEANTLLALCYRFGWGTSVDIEKAIKYLLIAAELGDQKARYEAGYWLPISTYSTRIDNAKALEYLTLSSESGYAPAQYQLAHLFDTGYRVKRKDERQALSLFRASAEQGYPSALLELGNYYFNGKGGLKIDFTQAAHCYQLAADKGDADAQVQLGMMLLRKRGVKRDVPLGVYYIKAAAEQENVQALFLLGAMYERGEGVDVDLAESVRLYQAAKDKGSSEAERRLKSRKLRGYVNNT